MQILLEENLIPTMHLFYILHCFQFPLPSRLLGEALLKLREVESEEMQ